MIKYNDKITYSLSDKKMLSNISKALDLMSTCKGNMGQQGSIFKAAYAMGNYANLHNILKAVKNTNFQSEELACILEVITSEKSVAELSTIIAESKKNNDKNVIKVTE